MSNPSRPGVPKSQTPPTQYFAQTNLKRSAEDLSQAHEEIERVLLHAETVCRSLVESNDLGGDTRQSLEILLWDLIEETRRRVGWLHAAGKIWEERAQAHELTKQ